MLGPIILTIFILSLVITFLFLLLTTNFLNKKIRINFDNLSNTISEFRVDIKEKTVFVKRSTKDGQIKKEIYSLDKFIYMISLNPDSKSFRELLKLINNDVEEENLIKKIRTIKNFVSFFINYDNEKKSLAYTRIILDGNGISKFLKFQVFESFIHPKNISNNFLMNKIEYYNDLEIFEKIKKDVLSFRGENWSLVKICLKEKSLITSKEQLILDIYSLKIKWILKQQKINSYINNKNEIIFAKPITKKTFSNSQKYWVNMINSFFINNKHNDYLDININDFQIISLSEKSKELDVINLLLIFSKLLSESSDKKIIEDHHKFMKLKNEAKKISFNSEKLISGLKSGKIEIRNKQMEIVEGESQTIIDYFIDANDQEINDILKYCYKNKMEILNFVINYVYEEAKTQLNNIFTTQFDIYLVDHLIPILENLEKTPNFYITLLEDINVTNYYLYWKNLFNRISSKEFNFIQMIKNIDKHSINFSRSIKPKIILISKNNKYKYDYTFNNNINFNNLNFNKGEKTKLLILE